MKLTSRLPWRFRLCSGICRGQTSSYWPTPRCLLRPGPRTRRDGWTQVRRRWWSSCAGCAGRTGGSSSTSGPSSAACRAMSAAACKGMRSFRWNISSREKLCFVRVYRGKHLNLNTKYSETAKIKPISFWRNYFSSSPLFLRLSRITLCNHRRIEQWSLLLQNSSMAHSIHTKKPRSSLCSALVHEVRPSSNITCLCSWASCLYRFYDDGMTGRQRFLRAEWGWSRGNGRLYICRKYTISTSCSAEVWTWDFSAGNACERQKQHLHGMRLLRLQSQSEDAGSFRSSSRGSRVTSRALAVQIRRCLQLIWDLFIATERMAQWKWFLKGQKPHLVIVGFLIKEKPLNFLFQFGTVMRSATRAGPFVTLQLQWHVGVCPKDAVVLLQNVDKFVRECQKTVGVNSASSFLWKELCLVLNSYFSG